MGPRALDPRGSWKGCVALKFPSSESAPNFIHFGQVDRPADEREFTLGLSEMYYQWRQSLVSEVSILYCGTPLSCLNFISWLRKQKEQFVAYNGI